MKMFVKYTSLHNKVCYLNLATIELVIVEVDHIKVFVNSDTENPYEFRDEAANIVLKAVQSLTLGE